VYRHFVNARSPLRLLERGLHGGLGAGNLGLVLAGHGVGKTAFLVGVALDELLRGGHVLHVATDESVAHVRAHYDTVFDELASSTHLEDEARVRQEADRRRCIRVYPHDGLTPGRLRDAVALEAERGAKPSLLVVEGLDFAATPRGDVEQLRALARQLGAEIWLSAAIAREHIVSLPPSIREIEDMVSVILTLDPGQDAVELRALKDHDNPDVSDLHVALDPRTLLLIRA
jgi:hypothetical protein